METKKVPYARTDFGPPPAGYVAGLGRGAVGFITRADIGPSAGASNIMPGQHPPPGFLPTQKTSAQYDPMEFENLNDTVFDKWTGYQTAVFTFQNDAEDREAEEVYGNIDERMDERRRQKREQKIKEELKKMQQEHMTISQQFSDLKRSLKTVTQEQWMNIPEPVDMTIKKRKVERYIPVPDSVISSGRQDMQMVNTIETTPTSSSNTLNSLDTPIVNLNDLGSARSTVMSVKLDRTSDAVTGIRTVDKKGYLTELQSVTQSTLPQADIGDFKRARTITESLIKSNPKNADSWIAGSRIEELDGKVQNARDLLALGLQHCPESEDLWLEAARLETYDKSKAILAKGISHLPKSIKIWLAAAGREKDEQIKKKILKKALEHVPNSPQLWKDLIELEKNEDEARTLLYKAVECIPGNVDMWLALAKLETYDSAKLVLNKARKALPTEPAIWIAAAKLEEAQGQELDNVHILILNGIKILKKNDYILHRDEWIEEAEIAERSDSKITCQAIIKAVLGEGVPEIDRMRIWIEDLDKFVLRDSMTCARATYYHMMEELQYPKEVFFKGIEIESKYAKTKQDLTKYGLTYMEELLQLAVEKHPNEQNFWITAVKRIWNTEEQARDLLKKAELAIPKNNQEILILRAKLEKENNKLEEARQYLIKAKQCSHNERAYGISIKMEIHFGNLQDAWKESQTSMKMFPKCEKTFSLASKVAKQIHGLEESRQVLELGLKNNPTSLLLWMLAAQLETDTQNYARARPLLEKARSKIDKSPELWRLAVQVELSCGNRKGAIFILSKALTECRQDGILWSIGIELEPKSTRKKKIVDALNQCQDDPQVNLSVAKLFWKERKYEKTKKWIEKAVLLDKNIGDSWAALYLFYKTAVNDAEKASQTLLQILDCKPKGGRLWKRFRKSEEAFKLANETQKVEFVLEKVIKILESEISYIE